MEKLRLSWIFGIANFEAGGAKHSPTPFHFIFAYSLTVDPILMPFLPPNTIIIDSGNATINLKRYYNIKLISNNNIMVISSATRNSKIVAQYYNNIMMPSIGLITGVNNIVCAPTRILTVLKCFPFLA